MPMDKSGKYHMSPHHAKAADAQKSKPGTEPQPGPDGMSGGKDGGKDLSAGIPTPGKPSMPSGLSHPSVKPSVSSAAGVPSMGGGDSEGASDAGDMGEMGEMGEPQHPANDAADQMGMHMATMDPAQLMQLHDKLQTVLQQITDLLGGGASESQGAMPQAAPVLGGY